MRVVLLVRCGGVREGANEQRNASYSCYNSIYVLSYFLYVLFVFFGATRLPSIHVRKEILSSTCSSISPYPAWVSLLCRKLRMYLGFVCIMMPCRYRPAIRRGLFSLGPPHFPSFLFPSPPSPTAGAAQRPCPRAICGCRWLQAIEQSRLAAAARCITHMTAKREKTRIRL